MHADIFCKRVDNYGDIGVCWRLARRLRQTGGWRVRLWIDDLAAFAHMEPRCAPGRDVQDVDDITIVSWSARPPALEPGDVVIEAFACDPPEAFRLAMRRRPPIWINLEYLSAEPWVESHHKLPSPQPDGLMKYFFFPGFTPATGGLLREADLGFLRDEFRRSPDAQGNFLADLGVPSDVVAHWTVAAPLMDDPAPDGTAHAHQARAIPGRPRLVTLFCYPDAPLAGLVSALGRDPTSTLLVVPEGVALGLEDFAGASTPGLMIARVPFLPQDDYDRLLWCADLNFVRGEDSVVRAGWAGRPLIWQIYPQGDDVHLGKLDAWLDRYRAPLPARRLIHAWNTAAPADTVAAAWRDATTPHAWRAWEEAARAWDAEQSAYPDLAVKLIRFCAELYRKC